MESAGGGSLMRNRRLESFFNTNSSPEVEETLKIAAREEVRRRPQTDGVYVDDDGWIASMVSCIRIIICFLSMMATTFIWAIILLLLLPWPCQRIRQSNIYGHVTGRMLMWILGNPLRIEGAELSNERAIYICNHASPIDIFLMMWLTPTGTVGIAKKQVGFSLIRSTAHLIPCKSKLQIFFILLWQIIWYPLFGQLYVLANHLRIDRSNPTSAIKSMKEVANTVVQNNLSLIIFPEGTRSKNGRLLPFKKGFVHLALQSRLPIVPMVFTGTHRAWRKGSLRVRPTPITVKYLPPIKTDCWTADRIDDYVKTVHNLYVETLPASQRPLPWELPKTVPIQS